MIHPFAGLRYSAAAGDPADLVTLPYDRIRVEELAALRARSRHCAVHLIRGESGPSDTTWYAEAARKLLHWRESGVLRSDEEPAYYVLEQRFPDEDGATLVRTAVVGALDLGRAARVLPHERTHARAREDRFRLLSATRCHLGLVFLLRGGEPELSQAADGAELLARVPSLEGAEARFLRVAEPGSQARLAALLADGPFVIADGHHRFATALRYAAGNPRARRLLVGVADALDPSVRILATHRVFSRLPQGRVQALLRTLGPLVPWSPGPDPASEVRARGPGTIGLVPRAGPAWLLVRPAPRPEDPEDQDVARFHREIAAPLLEGLEVEDHLDYLRDAALAVARARAGALDLAAILAPVPAATVFAVARSGAVMPQKSTDFYPKLPTGFVYLPAED
jgi:uncharacterized protein (DUF1015 family)